MTVAQTTTGQIRPQTLRRVGYGFAALVNLVVLWIMHNLLDWGWPSFLTESFRDLLPLITVSLVATALVNVVWVFYDRQWFKSLAQIALNGISLLVAVRTWQVFPFDFSAYSFDWELVARIVIAVGFFGIAVATIAELVKLVQAIEKMASDAPASG